MRCTLTEVSDHCSAAVSVDLSAMHGCLFIAIVCKSWAANIRELLPCRLQNVLIVCVVGDLLGGANALPSVRAETSGVRRGRDVVRALALGATAVFVGRPVFWGLALGGQAGVARMIEMFAK